MFLPCCCLLCLLFLTIVDLADGAFSNTLPYKRGTAGMLRLLEWAETNSVQILAVNMPLQPYFEQEIPPEVVEAYTNYVVGLEAQFSHFHTYDGNYGSWRTDTSYFLDPDHLGEKGSLGFSQIVCEEAIAPLMAASD